jgi:dipeptidase E
MPTAMQTIVTMGGGGFSMEPANLALDDYVLSLTGRPRPRVCFVPTASGDSVVYVCSFYAAMARLDCTPTHLPLFQRGERPVRDHLLAQDVVYVGGGNTANLLAVWRVHGVDTALREAWERGVVLTGVSAGSICWFESGTTDSFGPALQPLRGGLGLLPGSHSPHYDGEPARRPTYHSLVARGELADGWALDDGAAIRWDGTTPAEFVSSRPAARCWRVRREGDTVVEERVAPRLLPAVAGRA